MEFKIQSAYKPQGDQATAIAQLLRGLREGEKHQVLLGVTGSGKTFTMANVVAELNRPTLVIAPNKTLAAQLFNEFRVKPSALVNSVITRPHPPRRLMSRRNTLSVSPAMGDRKVGGSTIKSLMRITSAAPDSSNKAPFYRGFVRDGNSKGRVLNW